LPPVKRRRRGPLPRQKEPKPIEREYFRELRGYLDVAKALVQKVLGAELEALARQNEAERSDALRQDVSASARVRQLMAVVRERMANIVDEEKLDILAISIARRTSEFQRAQLAKQIQAAVGSDVLAQEPNLRPRMEAFTATNVSLIKSIPETYFGQVESTVLTYMRQGARHEEMAEALQERFGVAESRAALIARDQTLKFFGELNQARQEALGVEGYEWKTSLDNRVRPEHEAREGRRYRWDTPPADGHPGQAVACRCTASPLLEEFLEGVTFAEPRRAPPPPTPPPPPRRR
jgi:SPP1 gp7 family putative phage head morphogenesis protein